MFNRGVIIIILQTLNSRMHLKGKDKRIKAISEKQTIYWGLTIVYDWFHEVKNKYINKRAKIDKNETEKLKQKKLTVHYYLWLVSW